MVNINLDSILKCWTYLPSFFSLKDPMGQSPDAEMDGEYFYDALPLTIGVRNVPERDRGRFLKMEGFEISCQQSLNGIDLERN